MQHITWPIVRPISISDHYQVNRDSCKLLSSLTSMYASFETTKFVKISIHGPYNKTILYEDFIDHIIWPSFFKKTSRDNLILYFEISFLEIYCILYAWSIDYSFQGSFQPPDMGHGVHLLWTMLHGLCYIVHIIWKNHLILTYQEPAYNGRFYRYKSSILNR